MVFWLWFFACDTADEDSGFVIVLDPQETGFDSGINDSAMEPSTEDTENVSLVIEGDWEDAFGDLHSITQQEWINPTGVFNITQFDNDAGWLIAQNDAGNPFNAGKYSKFEWLDDNQGQSFFCQSVFEANTEGEAATISADRDNLETGCREMGWKRYRSAMPLRGTHIDDSSMPHTINAFRWTWGAYIYHIVEFPYQDQLVITRNDQNNPTGSSQWSQLAWVEDSGSIWVCNAGIAEDIESAREFTPDRSNVVSGCNGDGWSQLLPQ